MTHPLLAEISGLIQLCQDDPSDRDDLICVEATLLRLEVLLNTLGTRRFSFPSSISQTHTFS